MPRPILTACLFAILLVGAAGAAPVPPVPVPVPMPVPEDGPAPEAACGLGAARCTWERVIGAATDDRARGAALHPGGEVTVVGTVRPPAGIGSAAWAMRLDRTGRVLWHRDLARDGIARLVDVAPAPDGGALAVGQRRRAGERQLDFWALGLAADGRVAGEVHLAGGLAERVRAVAARPGGGFWAAGSAGPGDGDLWLARLDAGGRPVAEHRHGDPGGSDGAYAVAALPDGGAVVAGLGWSGGARRHDIWVLRVDAAGAIVWQRRFDEARVEAATAVVPLPGGDIAVAGVVGVDGTLSDDLWVARLAPDGTPRWRRRLGGDGRERAYGVVPLAGGGIGVAAIRWFEPSDAGDAWLIGLDAGGAVRWERRYGGHLWDRPQGLLALDDGLLMVGHTSSSGAGFEDAWLLRLDAEGRR